MPFDMDCQDCPEFKDSIVEPGPPSRETIFESDTFGYSPANKPAELGPISEIRGLVMALGIMALRKQPKPPFDNEPEARGIGLAGGK